MNVDERLTGRQRERVNVVATGTRRRECTDHVSIRARRWRSTPMARRWRSTGLPG